MELPLVDFVKVDDINSSTFGVRTSRSIGGANGIAQNPAVLNAPGNPATTGVFIELLAQVLPHVQVTTNFSALIRLGPVFPAAMAPAAPVAVAGGTITAISSGRNHAACFLRFGHSIDSRS